MKIGDSDFDFNLADGAKNKKGFETLDTAGKIDFVIARVRGIYFDPIARDLGVVDPVKAMEEIKADPSTPVNKDLFANPKSKSEGFAGIFRKSDALGNVPPPPSPPPTPSPSNVVAAVSDPLAGDRTLIYSVGIFAGISSLGIFLTGNPEQPFVAGREFLRHFVEGSNTPDPRLAPQTDIAEWFCEFNRGLLGNQQKLAGGVEWHGDQLLTMDDDPPRPCLHLNIFLGMVLEALPMYRQSMVSDFANRFDTIFIQTVLRKD